MLGLLRRSQPLLASYRNAGRLADTYEILITKKPVEYDLVVVDANAFVAVALGLTKNITPESRRHKEVARHVHTTIQQLLRRVVSRQSLLIAFDGASAAAKVHELRHGGVSRRVETRRQRLPATPLMSAVEERLIRSMPLPPGLSPCEVVISSSNVAGAVEQKAVAWALDLAARDGADRHTTRSLCLLGGRDLCLSLLGLTPFFEGTHVRYGATDLHHARLEGLLDWLGLENEVRAGDTVSVATARTDALLVLLVSQGAEVAALPAVAGSNVVTLLDAFHRLRGSPLFKEEGGFRLVRDKPGGELELDLLTLYLLYLPPAKVAEELAVLSTLAVVVPSERGGTGNVEKGKTLSVSNGLRESSYLEQLLSTLHMLCYGTDTPNVWNVPAYMEVMALADSNGTSHSSAPTVTLFIAWLRQRVVDGIRYQSSTASAAASSGATALHIESKRTIAVAPGKDYDPFWTKDQPMTAAEFATLAQCNPSLTDQLLRNYVPLLSTSQRAEASRSLSSSRLSIADARSQLQQIFATADPVRPHPMLCLGPSLCWTQQEKSRMWALSYVDLGTRARAADVRYVRGHMSGMQMTSSTGAAEGPRLFDAVSQTWVAPPAFPFPVSPSPPTPSPLTSADGGKAASEPPSRRTLKVLTWNVMFDRFNGQPTPLGMPGIEFHTPLRYPVLAKLIEAEQADVIGLQEVEPAFADYLAEQPWCREKYLLSSIAGSAKLDPWGVLLLVRRDAAAWPIQDLTHVNLPAWDGHVSLMPMATLNLLKNSEGRNALERCVHICSMHLLAPFLSTTANARTAQDQTLRLRLTRQLHGDTLVMGDFNDWPGNEFQMPAETHYVDCWPVLHPGNYGKTMDESNTFCKLKIEEIFFGRADKVFLRSKLPTQPLLKPAEAHLVGIRSVNTENGNTAAPAYLFPSDHYGVSVTFDVA